MKPKRQLLIMIGGPPWVGKTTCAREVFTSLENSAWLDGDDVWRVNPFSVEDPRLRNSDRNMSFVLRTYLESRFDYVLFSSVVLTDKPITNGILNGIGLGDYDILFFMLSCSRSALEARSVTRDNMVAPESRFMRAAKGQDAIFMDTTEMTPGEVAQTNIDVVRDPSKAGLVPVWRGGIREWKREKTHNNCLKPTRASRAADA
jgi:cytidylate kinase